MSSHCNRHARGMLRALCLGLVVAAALPITAGPVQAQPSKEKRQAAALALYKKGRIQYDLGNFEQAIDLFKRAYEASPHQSFLFNIAQSYRLMDDCKNALFFYKRYLSVAGVDGKNSDLVQQYIKEMSERCTEEDAGPDESGGGSGGGSGDGGGGASDSAGRSAPGSAGGPGAADPAADPSMDPAMDRARGQRRHPRQGPVIVGAVELGPAFLDIGDAAPDGAQLSLSAGAGYPIDLGRVDLSLGALFTYTPLPWSNADAEASGTSSLTSLLFNVAARFWLLDRVAVRGDIGVGALFLGGLEQDNVFVPPGTMASGTLSMFNVRAGIGADIMLTRNLVLSASPAVYSYSPPKQGLRQEIDGFARFEIMAGIGYRL